MNIIYFLPQVQWLLGLEVMLKTNSTNRTAIRILFSPCKNSLVFEDTLGDIVLDEWMSQVFVKIFCSLSMHIIELIRLMNISLVMNDFQQSSVQILLRI
jgi:hypothetical protein